MSDTNVRRLLAMNMKYYRQILNISQMDLAGRVGCSVTLIGNIETQRRFPSAANINRIAQALNVHPADLFADNVQPYEYATYVSEVKEKLETNIKEAISSTLIKNETSSN